MLWEEEEVWRNETLRAWVTLSFQIEGEEAGGRIHFANQAYRDTKHHSIKDIHLKGYERY
jgi:hypothetical protein